MSTVRYAETAHPLVDLLNERWSPRSFDATAEISEAQLTAILEAARWAPSAANFQPRRFIVATRGSLAFDQVVSTLAEGNQPWAVRASALIVGVAVTTSPEGAAYRWAEYDLGQAIAHLTVQAHAEGLHVHQIGGFDPAMASDLFSLDAHLVPVSVSAIGFVADAEQLGDRFAARELAVRSRLTLDEIVLHRS